MAELGLIKRIPSSLRNDFWTALIETVDEEISLMKEEIEKKKVLLSPSLASKEQLLDLASFIFQLEPDYLSAIETTLINLYGLSEEEVAVFLRAELLKTPFQVMNKANLSLYRSIFNLFTYSFDKEICYYKKLIGDDPVTGEARLIRDLLLPIFSNIDTFYEPYAFIDDSLIELTDEDGFSIGFNSVYSSLGKQLFTGSFIPEFSTVQTMDDGTTLDADTTSYLDITTEDAVSPTRHIALEIVADQLINRISPSTGLPTDYLLTGELAYYIFGNANAYRRAVEVPHVGMQLTVLLDNSGYWNTHSSDGDYTIENIKLKGAVNPAVLAEGVISTSQISSIKFGYGSQELPSYEGGGTFPTNLQYPIASKIPYDEEVYSSTTIMGAIAEYRGKEISGQILPIVFDGSTTEFNNVPILGLATSLATPLVKDTISLAIVNTSNLAEGYPILDDGYGNLSCTNPLVTGFSGTIDYTTGLVSINTGLNPFSSNYIVYIYSMFSHNPVSITEAGLFVRTALNSSVEQLLAYITFPAMEFSFNLFHTNIGILFEL
jgi:hypothetical protein